MTKSKNSNPLPGDLSEEEQVHRMLRVNHAGEYGAARIYEGQLAILGAKPCGDVIREMKDQEQKHLDLFDDLVIQNRVRPTALSPVWHWAGYGLGMATALLGEKAAMACTVAVEEVIDDHYAEQEAYLADKPKHKKLRDVISECRADEQHHRDTGLAHDAENAPAYPILKTTIKAASKLAIWLSKRV